MCRYERDRQAHCNLWPCTAKSQSLSQYTYHAGLWSVELLQCLLWQVKNAKPAEGTPSRRPIDTTAPLWPWLSVNGVVEPHDPRYPEESRKPFADIIACVTTPLSPDHPYGNVWNAHIVLSGCLFNRRTIHWPLLGKKPWLGEEHSVLCAQVRGQTAIQCTIDDIPAFLSRWNNRIIKLICLPTHLFVTRYAIYLFYFDRAKTVSYRVLILLSLTVIVWLSTGVLPKIWMNYGSPNIFFPST